MHQGFFGDTPSYAIRYVRSHTVKSAGTNAGTLDTHYIDTVICIEYAWSIIVGRLTATEVKQAKARDKVRKLTDGGGLHLQVKPTGARYWRYNCRYAGMRKTLALGVYPEVSLKKVEKLTRNVSCGQRMLNLLGMKLAVLVQGTTETAL